MKLATEFQSHSLKDPSPTLLEQLKAAVGLMNKNLAGHDYVRPLLFVVTIDKKEGEEETMFFNVFELQSVGGVRSQYKLSLEEMEAAKTLPQAGHARMFFITPDARGACDVLVAEERTPLPNVVEG